jgi:hypothetical protein
LQRGQSGEALAKYVEALQHMPHWMQFKETRDEVAKRAT